MTDILIATKACSVHFDDPMLALAWLRVLIHDIPPDWFVALVRALNPMNSDIAVQAQHTIDVCMGVGT